MTQEFNYRVEVRTIDGSLGTIDRQGGDDAFAQVQAVDHARHHGGDLRAANIERQQIAERIVTCWNAMAGITDPAALVASHAALVEALASVAPYLNTMLVDDDPDDESIGWESDGENGHTKPIDFTMGQIRKVNTALATAREVMGEVP